MDGAIIKILIIALVLKIDMIDRWEIIEISIISTQSDRVDGFCCTNIKLLIFFLYGKVLKWKD